MKKLFLALIFILVSVVGFSTNNFDSLYEKVYEKMSQTSNTPTNFKWAPSSKYYSYLFDKEGDGKDLYLFDLKTGKDIKIVDSSKIKGKESLEEKMIKERMRIGGSGISFYSWFHNSDKILLSSAGKLFIYDLKLNKLTFLKIKISPILFPKLSKNDSKVAFVSKGELYCNNFSNGVTEKLTNSSGKDSYNGLAEYVVAEELDRFDGFWWSPDGNSIYYTHVDESKMNKIALPINTKFESDYVIQKYPFAGKENAKVSLHKVNIKSRKSIEITYPVKKENYIVKVYFIEDNLLLNVLSRDQKDLYYFYYETLNPKTLVHIHNDKWINLNSHFNYIKSKAGFIYGSEESGFCHLYFYKLKTNTATQLTKGQWMVKTVAGITDEKIFFTSTMDSPNDTVLCSYDFKFKKTTKIQESGTHKILMAPDTKHYIDSWSDLENPSTTSLVSLDGKTSSLIKKSEFPKMEELTKMVTKRIQFKASDGTTLFGLLTIPENIDNLAKYPLIVETYGGPHAQVAANRFLSRNYYWYNYLITKGFVVFNMDNRGSANRGLEFEQAIFKNMGDLEIKDQIEGVNYICKKFPFINKEKVGIWGWSYGGYMTCMAMTKFAGFFKAGVVVAPVTDWQLYDSAYTERYMETIKTNPEGYKSASVLSYVDKMTGELLLMHGLSDDNVHFQNTELLLNSLVKEGKFIDLMTYPGKKHSIRGNETRKYLFWKITDFFVNNLQ